MFKRILMAEADASGGNGAVAQPVASNDTPAPANGAPLAITQEAFDAAIAAAVDKGFAKARDSFHAEARRVTAAPSKTKPTATEPTAPAQPDPIKLRKLDRAINSAGVKLTDFAYELAEQAWMSSGDDSDPVGWVKGFSDRLGIHSAPVATPAPTAQPNVTPAAPARNAAPVSDRGSPPVSAVPLEDQNVLSMSPSDREALLKLKGTKWFTDKVLEQSKGQTIKLR